LTYTWDFGDGSPTASGPTASHVYGTVGSYTATLTMTSTEGSSTSPGIAITVNQDPNPKFYVKPTGSTGAGCGPITDPCSSIAEAQSNAVANGIHTIRVAGGSYGRIDLASDMDITGGWLQDFSDFGPSEVTSIFGTGTQPAVSINGVSNSSISGVSAQGVARTSGDATGILVTGGSTGIKIGDIDSPQTLIAGGTGPNATGVLVTGGSSVTVENAKINSGTTTGSGSSAYGLRALGLSVVNVVLSEITGQPGVAGVSAPGGVPAQAPSGCAGGDGANASAGYNNGGTGGAGCAAGGVRNGGNGGYGGTWSYSFPSWSYHAGKPGA
ncbi:MAG: PKD domain-containing protein, partial [Microthrixaceae bacterium]|nr:PKD domain-containing protein [Microthrixaceae bacterium]